MEGIKKQILVENTCYQIKAKPVKTPQHGISRIMVKKTYAKRVKEKFRMC